MLHGYGLDSFLRLETVWCTNRETAFRARAAPLSDGCPVTQVLRRDPVVNSLRLGGSRPAAEQASESLVHCPRVVVALDEAQRKAVPRPVPSPQAHPNIGGEHPIEVEGQLGLCPDLTIVQVEVLLGVPQDELDWEACQVEADQAFRCQIRAGAVE